jgi:hypothetical protein
MQHVKETTGQIEIHVEKFLLLNAADREMPFLPSDTQNLVWVLKPWISILILP